MKLTLDQLKVDSYSTQICENELTEVKGGSGWICVVAALFGAAAQVHDYMHELDDQSFWEEYDSGVMLDEVIISN